jgi:hypothetical protein
MKCVAVVSLVVVAACGAPDIQLGSYEVTSGRYQDTGTPFVLDPPLTLEVAATPDGIAITSFAAPLSVYPANIPADGDRYRVEEYTASVIACEAGPNKTCAYAYEKTVVTVPDDGRIHIEHCAQRKIETSCSSAPQCGDSAMAKEMLADKVPCDVPQLVDAKRTSGAG